MKIRRSQMPYIRVANADTGKFDYASRTVLDRLIETDRITHFFRPSKKCGPIFRTVSYSFRFKNSRAYHSFQIGTPLLLPGKTAVFFEVNCWRFQLTKLKDLPKSMNQTRLLFEICTRWQNRSPIDSRKKSLGYLRAYGGDLKKYWPEKLNTINSSL